jgi:hypothetical protein
MNIYYNGKDIPAGRHILIPERECIVVVSEVLTKKGPSVV